MGASRPTTPITEPSVGSPSRVRASSARHARAEQASRRRPRPAPRATDPRGRCHAQQVVAHPRRDRDQRVGRRRERAARPPRTRRSSAGRSTPAARARGTCAPRPARPPDGPPPGRARRPSRGGCAPPGAASGASRRGACNARRSPAGFSSRVEPRQMRGRHVVRRASAPPPTGPTRPRRAACRSPRAGELRVRYSDCRAGPPTLRRVTTLRTRGCRSMPDPSTVRGVG